MSPRNGWLFAQAITFTNVLIASGFSLAAVLAPATVLPAGTEPNAGTFILACYAAARTIPLAIFAMVAAGTRSFSALMILGSLAGIVQALDGVIGLMQHDAGKTIGPFVLAVLQGLALVQLWRLQQPD